MIAVTQSIDPTQLPAGLSAAILFVVLPLFCGLAVGAFIWMVMRWVVTLMKVGAILGFVLAVLGLVDLELASTHGAQLWDAILALHRAFGQRVIEILMGHPVSAGSLSIGICAGLVLCRRRPRPRAVEAVA